MLIFRATRLARSHGSAKAPAARSACLREVAVPGADGHGLVPHEVGDRHGAAADADERSVTTVGGVPDRAPHRCGGVPAARREAAAGGRVPQLERAAVDACGAGPGWTTGATRTATGIRR